MNELNCCGFGCDKNRVICKHLKIENSSDYQEYQKSDKKDNRLLKRIIFEQRSKLLLAVKYDFYMCELTVVEDDDAKLIKFLKNNDIQIDNIEDDENHSLMMYDYYGRNMINDHFRMGTCIILNRKEIIWDFVDLVS